jgi:hypothetical protein
MNRILVNDILSSLVAHQLAPSPLRVLAIGIEHPPGVPVWSDDEKLRIVMESLQTPSDILDSETSRHIALIAGDVAALVSPGANLL